MEVHFESAHRIDQAGFYRTLFRLGSRRFLDIHLAAGEHIRLYRDFFPGHGRAAAGVVLHVQLRHLSSRRDFAVDGVREHRFPVIHGFLGGIPHSSVQDTCEIIAAAFCSVL